RSLYSSDIADTHPISHDLALDIPSQQLVHSPHRLVFFFQAEDGIRDRNVTGVQTCALPISSNSPGSRKRYSSENERISVAEIRDSTCSGPSRAGWSTPAASSISRSALSVLS